MAPKKGEKQKKRTASKSASPISKLSKKSSEKSTISRPIYTTGFSLENAKWDFERCFKSKFDKKNDKNRLLPFPIWVCIPQIDMKYFYLSGTTYSSSIMTLDFFRNKEFSNVVAIIYSPNGKCNLLLADIPEKESAKIYQYRFREIDKLLREEKDRKERIRQEEIRLQQAREAAIFKKGGQTALDNHRRELWNACITGDSYVTILIGRIWCQKKIHHLVEGDIVKTSNGQAKVKRLVKSSHKGPVFGDIDCKLTNNHPVIVDLQKGTFEHSQKIPSFSHYDVCEEDVYSIVFEKDSATGKRPSNLLVGSYYVATLGHGFVGDEYAIGHSVLGSEEFVTKILSLPHEKGVVEAIFIRDESGIIGIESSK